MPRKNRIYKKAGGQFRDATYKLIIGEGKAEEQYFNGLLPFIEEESHKRIKLKVFPYQDSDSALKHLVTKAIAFRSDFSDFTKGRDEVWIVADKDLSTDYQLAQALKQTQAEEMNLAISTPCFEIWLLLHLSDLTTTTYDLNPVFNDKPNRKAAQNCEKELKKILDGYNKTNIPMTKLTPYIQVAIERAKVMDDGGDLPSNIGTKVYKIVEQLDFK